MSFIKEVSINDSQDLQKVSQKAFYDTFSDSSSKSNMETFLNTNYSIQNLTNELNEPNSKFYFVYYQEQIAGYIKINLNDAQTEDYGNDYLEIERIYLLKEFQGSCLGSKLMDYAIQLAKSLNKKHIWLGVWEHNTKALKFYHKFNFIEKSAHNYSVGTDVFKDLILIKEI
ncbi:GNAT family N-acetyltransferase [Lactobacillus sp. S2-2]|uniref:GNAT family N-acetyltransferase n=1 Tax=Lactobacillus sp. S2-2 TaxID=2692917 RepID=UPI001F30A7B1|nr:GNAT family N-acetyltransferase [Lactobacillus sp. S2-2]MCF6514718.1 GNAT family N-acetyltransferase [Lactobacillus sp. S2-2]